MRMPPKLLVSSSHIMRVAGSLASSGSVSKSAPDALPREPPTTKKQNLCCCFHFLTVPVVCGCRHCSPSEPMRRPALLFFPRPVPPAHPPPCRPKSNRCAGGMPGRAPVRIAPPYTRCPAPKKSRTVLLRGEGVALLSLDRRLIVSHRLAKS